MSVLRVIGGFFLFAAWIFLTDEIWSLLAKSVVLMTVGELWTNFHTVGLVVAGAEVETRTRPEAILWDPLLQALLRTPASLILALIAASLWVVWRRREGTLRRGSVTRQPKVVVPAAPSLARLPVPSPADREFLPAALEILETPPSPMANALLLAICFFFAAALAWSYFGWLDIHAVAPGKIQP